MNRQQRRHPNYKGQQSAAPKYADVKTVRRASADEAEQESPETFKDLSTSQIIFTLNSLLIQLREREIPISDWDNSGKQLFRIQWRHGKLFYIAGEEKAEDPGSESEGK